MKQRGYLIALLVLGMNGMALAQVFSEQGLAIGFDHTYRHRALMGGGAAFFDFDGDEDDDLYVTGGADPDRIYRNNGDGTFSRVLDDIGLSVTNTFNTTAVSTGDIDNDGDRDIFVTTWEEYAGAQQPTGRSLLFRNDGTGHFTEVGESAGITDLAFGIGANFFDYDRDGFLDIYVSNHIETPNFLYNENGAVIGFDHTCYPNFLYHNNGDGTFTEVSQTMMVNNAGCALASLATDYDMDGDVDIYVANDFGPYIQPNALYRNDYPTNNFTDVGEATGAEVAMYGMGFAAGDYDHDQDLDYYITNIGANLLCENEGGVFANVTAAAGVENATVPSDGLNTTGWGTAFLDVDNDTWVDLYVANGRIPTLSFQATSISDPDKLYLNNGDGTFTDVSVAAGVSDISYMRGMAYSDYDQDGDLDIVTIALDELGGKSKFYVNETENDHHYLQLKLVGTISNRDAFGAKAWVYLDGLTLLQESYGGASHASQHSSVLHFGLGDHAAVDSVRIEWPNGLVETYENLAVDTRQTLVEGSLTEVAELTGSEPRIVVAPNPFADHITLFAPDSENNERLTIRLLTSSGQVVLEKIIDLQGQATLTINDQLPAGLYWLQLNTSAGMTVRKLIKQ
ncbi:MAG: VCBS repeat-containing protein [Lewinella sp.]|nr:VCBS repeat-containing protein [Lewinella sp.]